MVERWREEAAKVFAEIGRLTCLRDQIDIQLAAAKENARALNGTMALLERPDEVKVSE